MINYIYALTNSPTLKDCTLAMTIRRKCVMICFANKKIDQISKWTNTLDYKRSINLSSLFSYFYLWACHITTTVNSKFRVRSARLHEFWANSTKNKFEIIVWRNSLHPQEDFTLKGQGGISQSWFPPLNEKLWGCV